MCSGTQPALDLGFGLPPLPENAWCAKAFPPGLASHKRRRSVQKDSHCRMWPKCSCSAYLYTLVSLLPSTLIGTS